MGVVFYGMLTGKLPFEGKGQFEVMLAHVNSAPKHPSEVNAEVPREVGDIALKALAKEPVERFQTAQEFRSALDRLGAEHAPDAAAASVATTGLSVPVAFTEPPPASNGSQTAFLFDFSAEVCPLRA